MICFTAFNGNACKSQLYFVEILNVSLFNKCNRKAASVRVVTLNPTIYCTTQSDDCHWKETLHKTGPFALYTSWVKVDSFQRWKTCFNSQSQNWQDFQNDTLNTAQQQETSRWETVPYAEKVEFCTRSQCSGSTDAQGEEHREEHGWRWGRQKSAAFWPSAWRSPRLSDTEKNFQEVQSAAESQPWQSPPTPWTLADDSELGVAGNKRLLKTKHCSAGCVHVALHHCILRRWVVILLCCFCTVSCSVCVNGGVGGLFPWRQEHKTSHCSRCVMQ